MDIQVILGIQELVVTPASQDILGKAGIPVLLGSLDIQADQDSADTLAGLDILVSRVILVGAAGPVTLVSERVASLGIQEGVGIQVGLDILVRQALLV